MSNPSLDNALAFAEYGFPVFSVWGIKDGICRCPAGAACASRPGKHPIPREGFKAGSTDPVKVTKMLAAAGSAGNYGVVPAPNVVIIDADGEDWQDKLRALGLPKTLAVQTANGVHLFFFWPESYGPPPTHLFGWLVRSPEHPGYVVGPGSTHQSGFVYRIAHQNGHDIFTMLGRIATLPESLVTPPEGQLALTITGPRQPESVPVGGRHDYLRDTARFLRGRGLTGEALFAGVNAVNLQLREPKSEEDVRRAIGDVETKFGEDPEPISVAEVVQTQLIIPAATYVAQTDRHPRWCSPFAAFGYVSLISGPAKSGKSTFLAQLVRAREDGVFFLWGDPLPVGPTLYISEESGASFADKVDGLTQTDVMDWSMFVRRGLTKRSQVIEVLDWWCQDKTDPLIIIDTLAVWALIEDENDAMETTRAVNDFNVVAATHKAAIGMGHHSRKGGGEKGEGIRGSSAIFGAVALSIEFGYEAEMDDARRKLQLSGRFGSPTTEHLDFNLTTRQYEHTFATPSYGDLTKHLPLEVSGKDGLTREDLRGIWGRDPRRDIKKLVGAGEVVERVVRVGRVSKTVYFKAPAILDLSGSVSERMANIFALPGPDDDND